ncbi:beta-N-acetylhexosaminidase family protein [Paenarthrobacter ilicis]|uniref:beta-N-acetylhexosaminidase family protein n=1 Tax=Paenarthrobacter ilicis TaxID=43665 RepID=UPI003869BE7A
MNTAPARSSGNRRRSMLLLVVAGVLAAALVAAGWYVLARNGSAGKDGGDSGVPGIYPVPQHVEAASGDSVRLNGRVYVVAPAGTDTASVAAVQDIVAAAGGNVQVVPSLKDPAAGASAVYLGVAGEADVGGALKELAVDGDARSRDALEKPEGYSISTGKASGIPTAVLAGHDDDGVFHAVQTLRQLVKDNSVSPVRVSDWPLMETRGVIEGFYGIPWSHQARLDVIEFAGRQKMNTYIYSPKDDPLLRAKWRDLYSEQELGDLKELITTATSNHIRFTYALSPGIDVCYSRVADLDSAVAKLESLYALGVRSFVVPLDDIATKVQCSEDVQEFGTGQANLAKAQASFLNDVNQKFIVGKQGVQPLETVPTFYNGSGSTNYKKELGKALNPAIVVQWTGEDVVSHRITKESADTARRSYGTPSSLRNLVIWDNYPVNDFSQDHLFMAPVIGRDTDLHTSIRGIVTNPMIEPYLSLPAIFNYADLSWNGPAYDAAKSMDAALSLVTGQDPDVQAGVRAFVDLNQDWQDDQLTPSAPALRRDMDQFWAEYDAGKSPSGALKARAELLQRLPGLLPRMAEPGFAQDAASWTAAAANYGKGVEQALVMLDAAQRKDTSAVDAARDQVEAAISAANAKTQPTLELGVVTPVLGDGELQAFLERALQRVPAG